MMIERKSLFRLLNSGSIAGGILLAGASLTYAHDQRLQPCDHFQDPAACAGGVYGDSERLDQSLRGPFMAMVEVPLWTGLGDLTFPVSTNSPAAQRYFDQGLKLAYAFNHAEAARSFRRAQQADPSCAMCHWGEALVLGPNINAPMDDAAVGPAFAALTRAQKLAAGTTKREQALIAALAKRYAAIPAADRAALNEAYADAMTIVAAAFPADDDIAVLAAEAMMDLSPRDYWEAGGAKPKGRTARVLQLLEGVLARNPDHAGAIHLYIHAVEASDRPGRAEPYADRLRDLMPAAGYSVHMASLIYYRLGRYVDSMIVNKAAIAADEMLFARTNPGDLYRYGYFAHSIHLVMVSAQMSGDRDTAIAMAQKLQEGLPESKAGMAQWLQPIKAAPYFAHAQFSDAAVILSLPKPAAELPYVQAMWHYARAIALVHRRELAAAVRESGSIGDLAQNADFSSLTAGGIPAANLLALARHVIAGRIAQAEEDYETAAAEFTAAIAIEDRLPYMVPPFWHYPVRQSLGATLLLAQEPAAAAAVFRESLKRAPNNGWALYGLRESYKEMGENAGVAEADKQFRRAWSGDRGPLTLSRL
jgi:tetratricopeptide (TPR) repeat protein